MMLFTKQREMVFPKIRQHRELPTEDTDEKGIRDHKSSWGGESRDIQVSRGPLLPAEEADCPGCPACQPAMTPCQQVAWLPLPQAASLPRHVANTGFPASEAEIPTNCPVHVRSLGKAALSWTNPEPGPQAHTDLVSTLLPRDSRGSGHMGLMGHGRTHSRTEAASQRHRRQALQGEVAGPSPHQQGQAQEQQALAQGLTWRLGPHLLTLNEPRPKPQFPFSRGQMPGLTQRLCAWAP